MSRLPDTKYRVRTALPLNAWLLPLAVAVFAAPLIAEALADSGRLATAADLRHMHDDGQYRVCLQQIGRVLRSGNIDKAYDRYDLLLLRGDCLLHLDDPETAQLAYAAAAQSPVAAQAREGRATAMLIRRSAKMVYAPHGGVGVGGAGESISIANEEGRSYALRALLRDELQANDPAFRRGASARDLVSIRDVLPRLIDLYAVERTATGGDTQMRPILEAIAQRARTLIDQELALREQQVAAVQVRANQRVDYVVGGWWGGNVRRGLGSTDRRELRELIDYLQRVGETARLGQQLAVAFDGDGMPWDPLSYRASKLVRSAHDVLDAE